MGQAVILYVSEAEILKNIKKCDDVLPIHPGFEKEFWYTVGIMMGKIYLPPVMSAQRNANIQMLTSKIL